jgi:hypothetical protein
MPKLRIVFLLIISALFIAVLALLAYKTFQQIERRSCYNRIGEELQVLPEYNEIGNKYLAKINEALHEGMSRENVNRTLLEVVEFDEKESGIFEDTRFFNIHLKVCRIYENNIILSIKYVENGFENISLSTDD